MGKGELTPTAKLKKKFALKVQNALRRKNIFFNLTEVKTVMAELSSRIMHLCTIRRTNGQAYRTFGEK